MKIILTGATGYVGEGTLLELLKVDSVEKVLSVSRKPTGIRHEKLEEYLVSDFMIMPDKERMTFIYLSGAGTSPDGKQFWQQVKSKTEAEIQTKGFKRAFALRPAIMKWAKGQKHIQTMQYFFLPFYPLFRLLGQGNSMKEIALSMLTLVRDGHDKLAITPKDIIELAKKY